MFRGNHPAKIDEKGRLKLPAAFKQLLDEGSVTQVYITSEDGKCAQIWPLPEWERWERRLLHESSTMDEAVDAYLTWTSYYGHQVEIDSQARVTLPQLLRGDAKLDAEVAVVGKLTYLEVKNEEQLKQDMAARKVTPEHKQRLAAIRREQS